MWKSYRFLGFLFYFTLLIIYGETFEESISSELQLFNKLNFKNRTINEKEIKFLLFTRENPIKYEQIRVDYTYFLGSIYFDVKKPTKILVHGWKSSNGSTYNVLIKNAYLTQYDVNVIVVDWSKYSRLSYTKAREKVVDVAKVIAKFVDKLYDDFKINPDEIHIVGHSLGAHVAGIAGLKTARKIHRITGLDPAGPYFSESDEERISPNSAKFVDIIHTDGGSAGFYSTLGHVDFYPNGGTAIQPGCGWDVLTFRSHRRAFWLFAESITTPEGFLAEACDSWKHFKNNACEYGNYTLMGEHVSPSARGSYYLRTNYKTPFALETLNETYLHKK